MNPIRLTDPNGNTTGYICGICGKFPGEELLLDIWEPDTNPKRWSDDWNEMKLEHAKSCCVCRRCGERQVEAHSISLCAGCFGITKAREKEMYIVARRRVGYCIGRKARSLVLAKDRKAALDLLYEMREFSEQQDCAQWIHGLDVRVWNGDDMTPRQRRDFNALIGKAGGLWTMCKEGDVYLTLFVPLGKWVEDKVVKL